MKTLIRWQEFLNKGVLLCLWNYR